VTRPAPPHERSQVTGYRLVVPDGWFGVDLEPGRRERAVAALTERQFAGLDNAPHLKAQARQDLLDQAGAAYAAGGLEMFLSLQRVADIPIAASLVIFAMPAPETGASGTEANGAGAAGAGAAGAAADATNALVRELTGRGQQVSVTDLPAGRAVRAVPPPPGDEATAPPGDEATAPPGGGDQPAASPTLEVYIPIPGGSGWLLLSFAAPLTPLAPALFRLFDAICTTLRWQK
jgi:hypothetical protein